MIADLLGRYAIFLETVRGRYDLADRYYQRALALEPENPRILGHYALFCEVVQGDLAKADQLYRRALAGRPDDPSLLGNYAEFLEQGLGEYDQAEAVYRRALAAGPMHLNNLVNWATFLTERRRAHDQAEAVYRQVLAAEPAHRNGLFKYAIFLTDVRGALAGAEALYRRGLETAPGNLGMTANLIGLLFLQEKAEAWPTLDEALRQPAFSEPSADLAECLFYGLVYGPTARRRQFMRSLATLLALGIRSPGWDLAPHLKLAEQRRHPWWDWLPSLAAVLVDEADEAVLEAWPEWAVAKA